MVNTIFILNESFKTTCVLTVNGKNTFFDDLYSMDLSTCTESFEFSTNAEVDETNYVMFYYQNEYKLFTVIEIEQEHSEGKIITTCYCECTALELLNGAVRAFEGEYNCISFFEYLLKDTQWSIGTYSSTLAEKVVNVKVDKTTQVWSCIQDYMTEFGYELNTRVVYKNGHVKSKLIDIYAEGELGRKTYKRFEYGRNVEGITKKKDLYDFCTALILDTNQDVTDVEYNNKGFVKEKDSDVVLAVNNNKTYNFGRNYIYANFEDNDSQSGTEVVSKAIAELKRRSIPCFDYECDTALTYAEYEDVGLGDTVYVIDHTFNPIITLEARIGELEISFTDRNSCKCNLTNYKEIKSRISVELTGGIQDIIDTYFPITSDKLANGAVTTDKINTETYEVIIADSVGASKVVAEDLIAKNLVSINAEFEKLDTKYASVEQLNATNAKIDNLDVGDLSSVNAEITNLKAKDAQIENLIATKANISDLNATNATIEGLDAKYATIDLANIKDGCITTAMIGTGVIGTSQIADGSITDAKIVTLSANRITAGTLSVERLIISGSDKSVIFALNNAGDLTSTQVDTLDAYILTEKTITADKLVSKCITAEQIASKTITANEIVANTITGNEIAGNTITANHISGKELVGITIRNSNSSFKVDAGGNISGANITGSTITATQGAIGGFTLNTNTLKGTDVGMCSGNNAEWAFWAGANNGADAPFHVGHNGELYATKAYISGNITGETNMNIGKDITLNGQTVSAFRLSSNGNLKIGGYSAYVHPSDGLRKGVAEITSIGTIWSCSETDPYTYARITEGMIEISNTGYDPEYKGEHGGYVKDSYIRLQNGQISVYSATDDKYSSYSRVIYIGREGIGSALGHVDFVNRIDVTGDVTTSSQFVLGNNAHALKGVDTSGEEVTLVHVGGDNISKFGFGSWAGHSDDCYSEGTQFLGGAKATLRSKGVTFIGCNENKYIRFAYDSTGNYVFRPDDQNKDIYCGTKNYQWYICYALNGCETGSDRTLKENIQYLNYDNLNTRAITNNNITTQDCLDFITNDYLLATYNYISDNKKSTKLSAIAQDVIANADGSDNKLGQLIVDAKDSVDEEAILTMNQTQLLNVAIGAIQSLNDKVKSLEAKLNNNE